MAMRGHDEKIHIEGASFLTDDLVDGAWSFHHPKLSRDHRLATDLCRDEGLERAQHCLPERLSFRRREDTHRRVVSVERIREFRYLDDMTEDHRPAIFRQDGVSVGDGPIADRREISRHHDLAIGRDHNRSPPCLESRSLSRPEPWDAPAPSA